MRKIILLLIFIPSVTFSQNIDDIFINKGEVYFSFNYESIHQLNKLSKIISIDHETTRDIAYAYANRKEFEDFLDGIHGIFQVTISNAHIIVSPAYDGGAKENDLKTAWLSKYTELLG